MSYCSVSQSQNYPNWAACHALWTLFVLAGGWCPDWVHVEWALTVGEQFNHSAANRIGSLTLCPPTLPERAFHACRRNYLPFSPNAIYSAAALSPTYSIFHVNARQKSFPHSNLDPLESCTVWLKPAPGNRRRGFNCCVRRLPSRGTTHAACSDLLVGFGL